jgi:glycosyltransferase involved in cell wall biosynthesis
MAESEARLQRISVITCCWNSEPYIAQCIASVQTQQGVEVEHVFVDGGSTDGTLQRIQALPGVATGAVRWVTDVRGGISDAMNVGVQLATGDFIAHLHADDYYTGPQSLATAVAMLDAAGADWIFGRVMSDVGGELHPNNWAMPRFSWQRLLQGNFVAHPSLLMRRSFFLRLGGFDIKLKYAMDYDMWLRAARLSIPVVLDDYLAAFRSHPGSTTFANRLKSFEEDHAVRRKHFNGSLRDRLIHSARYWVRRRRVLRELADRGDP